MINHNQLSTSSHELSAEEKAVLSIAKLNEWRSRQYSILSGLRESDNLPNKNYLDTFNNSIEDSLKDYLKEQGVSESSANYNEIYSLFYDARIGTDNGDGISADAWGNSPASRGLDVDDHKSQSDLFKEKIITIIGEEQDADVFDIETLQTEAILENAQFDVAAARDEWSTVTAKRQGKAFGSVKNQDQVRDKYHERVQTLGILELEEQVNATDDDNEKNLKVIEFLFEEQRKLREQTINKLNDTKVGRFVTFMNKGSFGMRLLKGFGVGVAVGGIGTMAFGAVGAAAGATLAVAASRFVKGYAVGDRHRGMKTAQEEFVDSDDPVRLENSENYTVEQRLSYAADVYNEAYEDDTKKEQTKRKKALAWGIGSIATGAGVGYVLANLDGVQNTVQDVKDWVDGKSADVDGNHTTDIGPDDTPNDNESNPYDRDGDGYDNGIDVAPSDSTIGAVDFSEITREARWIEQGEGGYQTLQELGVPEEKWDAVWADAGEHFADEGKAYMMEDGHYGWSEPGRLTDADITELAKAARRQGVILDATFVA